MVCMGNIYAVTEEDKLNKERKILIILDDVIADMHRNKKSSRNSKRIIHQKQKNKRLSCFHKVS